MTNEDDRLREALAVAICSTFDMTGHDHDTFLQPDHCDEGLRDADLMLPRVRAALRSGAEGPAGWTPDRWWTDGSMVNGGLAGDERFISDAASPEDAERIATEHNSEIGLAADHDRQPYPTAWAYEQACRVRDEWRVRAERAEAAIPSPAPAALIHAVGDWMQLGAGDGTSAAEGESERLLRRIATEYAALRSGAEVAAAPGLDVDALADDVRYAGGNGTSDYWRGFNDGIDRLAARLTAKP